MTDASKQCWSCEASTPYDVGWCPACIAALPLAVTIDLNGIRQFPEPYRGRVLLTIADCLRQQYDRARPRLNLDDLEV